MNSQFTVMVDSIVNRQAIQIPHAICPQLKTTQKATVVSLELKGVGNRPLMTLVTVTKAADEVDVQTATITIPVGTDAMSVNSLRLMTVAILLITEEGVEVAHKRI
jgi:hypothetical protein